MSTTVKYVFIRRGQGSSKFADKLSKEQKTLLIDGNTARIDYDAAHPEVIGKKFNHLVITTSAYKSSLKMLERKIKPIVDAYTTLKVFEEDLTITIIVSTFDQKGFSDMIDGAAVIEFSNDIITTIKGLYGVGLAEKLSRKKPGAIFKHVENLYRKYAYCLPYISHFPEGDVTEVIDFTEEEKYLSELY